MPYKPSSRQTGRLQVGFSPDNDQRQRPYAPCFPIQSLMLAINKTRIDYFSLDVEGFELEVLQTVPWEKLDIRVVSVEYVHVPYGRQALVDYMRGKGYQMEAELNSIDQPNQVFVNDFIFVKP
jgi:Methyltransferase FkbM domain